MSEQRVTRREIIKKAAYLAARGESLSGWLVDSGK